jgi:hypothetical protein
MRTFNNSIKYKTFTSRRSRVSHSRRSMPRAAVPAEFPDTMPVLTVWEGSVLQYEVRPHHDGSCEFKSYLPESWAWWYAASRTP